MLREGRAHVPVTPRLWQDQGRVRDIVSVPTLVPTCDASKCVKLSVLAPRAFLPFLVNSRICGTLTNLGLDWQSGGQGFDPPWLH